MQVVNYLPNVVATSLPHFAHVPDKSCSAVSILSVYIHTFALPPLLQLDQAIGPLTFSNVSYVAARRPDGLLNPSLLLPVLISLCAAAAAARGVRTRALTEPSH